MGKTDESWERRPGSKTSQGRNKSGERKSLVHLDVESPKSKNEKTGFRNFLKPQKAYSKKRRHSNSRTTEIDKKIALTQIRFVKKHENLFLFIVFFGSSSQLKTFSCFLSSANLCAISKNGMCSDKFNCASRKFSASSYRVELSFRPDGLSVSNI